jgi:aspartyl-tRNA(Asn)/glutamyl-tRNA(Gln) amidotransferase subunit A
VELYQLGINDLAAGYRNREFSPSEVVEALLARIEAVGDEIDAFAIVTADTAIRQATEAESALAHGDERPLLGIPIAVKDLVDTAGIATEAGSALFAGRVPFEDAPVWSALREAGCVLIGKARTHEFALGSSTPPTTNPWNTAHIPGGSSGGSAAALAAGLTPAAIGTDTAGSIRIPSALCGTVGLKPTATLVPPTGVVPLSWSLDNVGPMARSPRDCALLLDAITPGAPGTMPPWSSDIEGWRVGVLSNPGPLSPGVADAVSSSARHLAEAGAVIDHIEIADFEDCVDLDFAIIAAEVALYHRPWYEQRLSEYTGEVGPRVGSGFSIGAAEYLEHRRRAEGFRTAFLAALGGRDLILLPGMPAPAPRIGDEILWMGEESDQYDHALCRNTSFANLTGLPALAIPAGLETGLPVGVQLAAGHFEDHRLLAAGQVLWERLHPPRLAPL